MNNNKQIKIFTLKNRMRRKSGFQTDIWSCLNIEIYFLKKQTHLYSFFWLESLLDELSLDYKKRHTYSEHFESNEKCQMENIAEKLCLLKKFLLMKPEINIYEFDLPNFCWVEWTGLVEVILAAFPQHASRVFSIPPATHVAYIYYLHYIHRKLLTDDITPSSERSFPNRALHCMC